MAARRFRRFIAGVLYYARDTKDNRLEHCEGIVHFLIVEFEEQAMVACDVYYLGKYPVSMKVVQNCSHYSALQGLELQQRSVRGIYFFTSVKPNTPSINIKEKKEPLFPFAECY